MRLLSADALNSIREVVDRGNCSGCGFCASLASNVRMEIDAGGFVRPVRVDESLPSGLSDQHFRRVCPGVALARPKPGSFVDEVFGSYFSIWEGFANDAGMRHRGSSGGVLTALSAWMLESGMADSSAAVTQSRTSARSVPVRITSRAEAEQTAGSRYAPVAAGAAYRSGDRLFIGKPCEVAACTRAEQVFGGDAIKLSFFCAGTPSQHATDELINAAGMGEAARVQYRGDGWPGRTRVEAAGSRPMVMDYETAWSKHLGPTIQWRCKVCPDGTGEFADIAVGDYWETDGAGYPTFEDRPGTSVVIARTERGHDLLLQAQAAGIVTLAAADLDRLRECQPSQVLRRTTLGGRLLGAIAAGSTPPTFRNFGILRGLLRRPVTSARAAAGTFRRIRQGLTGSI